MKMLRVSIVPLLVLFAMSYGVFVVSAWAAPLGGGPDCEKHPENPNCQTPEPTQVVESTEIPVPTECPGASCDDVPGNECDIQSPERNPHCDDTATPEPEEPTATPVPTDTPVPNETSVPTETPLPTEQPTEGPSPTPTFTSEAPQSTPTVSAPPHEEPVTGPESAFPIAEVLAFLGFAGLSVSGIKRLTGK